ncbi:hypothetical protein C0991_009162 [Blastosporella zonata]|nr:hypothetical protein C0991_009162 [Blastosporella zonata]
MPSPLYNACASGDFDAVRHILVAATPADIEFKDQFGVTPLIEAVRNAHTDIIRALLDKGADPMNGSTQGPPESYTSDPTIIDLLRYTASTRGSAIEATSLPAPFPYYPAADPTAYYPPPPAPESASPGGVGHLPPPDVARFIPCRYFPACRYGASCMFAHPQQYFPGSLPPPATYVAPYDPIHYSPNYFPPPPFQPNGVHPMSPPPHPAHGPLPSDVGMPPVQPLFSPNGLPPSPYGTLSPNPYPHPGQTPVPMVMSPPPPPPAPMYNNAAPPYIPHDASASYPVPPAGKAPQEFNGDAKTLDASGPNNHHPIRDGSGHRRGGPRRPSFNTSARRPPCLFFPSGRCKNGDDCMFPHVVPEANAPPQHVPYYSAGRATRQPRRPNGNINGNANGIAHINEKLASLSVQDAPPQRNGTDAPNGRPNPSETNGRPRFNHGGKNGFNQNGARPEKRPQPLKQQRVPNADEFPVLAGSVTPPTRATNGLPTGNGPTAAQVLSAPAPFRKEASSKDSSTRGASPDPAATSAAPKAEPNAVAPETTAPATIALDQPPVAVKLPISFAAVTAAPELPKEIALSA